MFVINILVSIIGMTALMGVLVFMTLKIIRGKKNLYTWMILIVLAFFLLLASWQALIFFNFN
ncbi:hypothetical protein [Jeotgalibacillus haloalkalitolerans]|uniref:DUF2768 domain-containing protein n=1 Tax=Jeotgalibacillus haloalkalitolerans TaxID=3104292 RepID=A0ABU5KHP6_9BACL|nr:hypothetical protein [Jeotgalibacillus sp. HH7-29]MDZ5710668.1 hypothetical protein [Jeotgalibacillus sp. HH7-29]